ncbi:MAG: hypothetical protein IRY99_27910, partial [Isosphaeraceae bacterium]|nr:hypothetical protein [Isosphaeraceae bacterium]
RLTIPLADGLPPIPARPYVLAVADPAGHLAESDKGDNTASFRTHIIGVISHGGIQDSKSRPPAWELRMAKGLRAAGYDIVIPYNWAAESRDPGAAAKQGPRVANLVRKASQKFPADEPVDLHLIGHSEGAVVVSQALYALGRRSTPQLQAGYTKVTLLDPHAANNNAPGGQYSTSSGLDGWLARRVIHDYQARAKDPLVSIPRYVDDAEVYYQHTPVSWNGANDGTYNLWGQVPVGGRVQYCDLTGPGISHTGETGVQVWYYFHVLPTLRDGGPFVCPTRLTAARSPEPGDVTTQRATVTITADDRPTYTGTAAPGATVRLFAVRGDGSARLLAAQTVAGPDGSWQLTARPLPAGPY